jgi:hypothetical protein
MICTCTSRNKINTCKSGYLHVLDVSNCHTQAPGITHCMSRLPQFDTVAIPSRTGSEQAYTPIGPGGLNCPILAVGSLPFVHPLVICRSKEMCECGRLRTHSMMGAPVGMIGGNETRCRGRALSSTHCGLGFVQSCDQQHVFMVVRGKQLSRFMPLVSLR